VTTKPREETFAVWYHKATPEQKKAHNERNKRAYHDRKMRGLCVRFGCKDPPSPDRVLCARHYAQVLESNALARSGS